MAKALDVIKQEHMALFGVVDCLDRIAKHLTENETSLDELLVGAILAYIEEFPDRFHHPKEDEYLFKALYNRCPDARPTLDALKLEHWQGNARIADVRRTFDSFCSNPSARAAFIMAVRDYVDFQYKHMVREEAEIFPLALEHLTEEDWARIDAAFSKNGDPLFGEVLSERFRELRNCIVHLSPDALAPDAQLSSDVADWPKRLQELVNGLER